MLRRLIWMVAVVWLATSCSDELGNDLSGFDENPLSQEDSDVLTARALLEGVSDHAYIQVRLVQLGVSMLTDSEGYFRLPRDLPEGEWEIEAVYPNYHPARLVFRVENGVPSESLKTMTLVKALEYALTTNGSFFVYGDNVLITMSVENVSTAPYTIVSSSSPAQATAVIRDGDRVFGGLVPGLGDGPVELEFNPGDAQFFELRLPIEGDAFIPGDFDIYATLTSDQTHPEYFKTVGNDFNRSLYAKLSPVRIRVD